jgi:hypothetical protein
VPGWIDRRLLALCLIAVAVATAGGGQDATGQKAGNTAGPAATAADQDAAGAGQQAPGPGQAPGQQAPSPGQAPGQQATDPLGEPPAAAEGIYAVLLQDADLFASPTSDGEIVVRVPAGSHLGYVGETTDAFDRAWFTVQDPFRSQPRPRKWLAPFNAAELLAFGGRAAVLADRLPPLTVGDASGAAVAAALLAQAAGLTAPAASGMPGAGAAQPAQAPWWTPAAELTAAHASTFDGVVALSAAVVEEAHVREAIELLGGRETLADWPADPLPGELFVPPRLPVVFVFDGSEWRLRRPARLFGDALSLLDNPLLLPDLSAPPLAGGPAIACWELVGALTPGGGPAGSIQVAPPRTPPRGRALPPPEAGEPDPANAPLRIQGLLPPAPALARVPPRVDPPPVPSGVEIRDDDGRQAVYLEQTLDPALVRRLRGREVVLDVVARTPAAAQSAATFGVNIQIDGGPATGAPAARPTSAGDPGAGGAGSVDPGAAAAAASGGRPAGQTRSIDAGDATAGRIQLSTSFTVDANPVRFAYPFTVPEAAESLTVRLLPLDRSIAVDQQGAVIFERVTLRLAHWPARPAAASLPLNRVTATSWEGARLHTRSPIALTTRPAEEVEAIWPQVAASDWSVEDKQLVLAGELRHGMSPEQVRLAWGEPEEEEPAGEYGIDHRWRYPDRYVAFTAGKVIAFATTPEEVAKPPVLRCSGGP